MLDLITSYLSLVFTRNTVPRVIANHDLISIQVNISKPKRKPLTETFRHFWGYSKGILYNPLVSVSHTFNQIMETDDVDLQITVFNDLIKCLDKCASVVTRQITRPLAPCFSDDLRQAIKKRNDTLSKSRKQA